MGECETECQELGATCCLDVRECVGCVESCWGEWDGSVLSKGGRDSQSCVVWCWNGRVWVGLWFVAWCSVLCLGSMNLCYGAIRSDVLCSAVYTIVMDQQTLA